MDALSAQGERWAHDGVALALEARPPPRWRIAAAALLVLAGLAGIWSFARAAPPRPADCAALRAPGCRDSLPPELRADPPSREAWRESRVASILEAVRIEDRLPPDVRALAAVDLAAPGPAAWAFLVAESGAVSLGASGVAATGPAADLARALEDYRAAQRGERVHFSERTRFVAELNAGAMDPEARRAALDALLAERERAVLDLGQVPDAGLRRAAGALADAEWRARRVLEQAWWAEQRAAVHRDAASRTRRAWRDRAAGAALTVACGVALWVLGPALRRRPVRIDVDARGVGIDGRRVPRDAIVWLGLRDARLRVVTRDGEALSRPVADERALARAVRAWRELRAVQGGGPPAEVQHLRDLVRRRGS